MSEEAAFRTAILSNPDENTPRLVYADWLDEHDRPKEAAFLRAWVRMVQADAASQEYHDAVREVWKHFPGESAHAQSGGMADYYEGLPVWDAPEQPGINELMNPQHSGPMRLHAYPNLFAVNDTGMLPPDLPRRREFNKIGSLRCQYEPMPVDTEAQQGMRRFVQEMGMSPHSRNIRRLTLEGAMAPGMMQNMLGSPNFSQLTHLSFLGARLWHHQLAELDANTENLKKLRTLEIPPQLLYPATEKDREMLERVLRSPLMAQLHCLCSEYFSPESLMEIMVENRHESNLRRLDAGAFWCANDMYSLFTQSPFLKKLQHLNLTDADLEEYGFCRILGMKTDPEEAPDAPAYSHSLQTMNLRRWGNTFNWDNHDAEDVHNRRFSVPEALISQAAEYLFTKGDDGKYPLPNLQVLDLSCCNSLVIYVGDWREEIEQGRMTREAVLARIRQEISEPDPDLPDTEVRQARYTECRPEGYLLRSI